MVLATEMRLMVTDSIRQKNPHLRSAIKLPLYINSVIKEFGSAVATSAKCHFGNIPTQVLAMIIDCAYIDPKLIPIQGALMELLKDVFTAYQVDITPDSAELLSSLQSDINSISSLLDKFVFNNQGQIVSEFTSLGRSECPIDIIRCMRI
jgi:hypothetical protein